MKTLLYSLIILLSISITNRATADTKPLSGQAKIDSLIAELPKAKGDTNHVKLLNSLAFAYYKINPDKGIEYGEQVLKLANKIDWKKGEAGAYSRLGVNYLSKSNYPKALDYYGRALKINKEIENKKGILSNLLNLGTVYKEQSNYSKALDYYSKALKINDKSQNKIGVGAILGNLGNIYRRLLNYPKALEYYQKALKIDKEIGNKIGVGTSFGNMGIIYQYQSNYPKALEYYNKALRINEEFGNKIGIARNLLSIGTIYKGQEDYQKALDNYGKAIKINKELGHKIGVAVVLANMGQLYLKLSQVGDKINPDELKRYTSLNKSVNLNKSIEFLHNSIDLLNEIGEIDGRSNTLELLANAYQQKGDYKNSDKFIREHHKLKDSVFSQENADKIAALEKSREDDLKQKEIEKQKIMIAEQEKREQLILYFSIGFFIVMAIVMIVIYRLLKRSDKLLYNVLPVSIAKRLKKKEHPISDYFTQASIVFIDIVNFTEHAQDEDPRRVVEALNNIFTKYDAIANKYGLEKIKTIGDSYMAAAGIPEVQKDNTHRAEQMALEVKAMMKDYHTADGTKIEVRIGLDCGPVVAGVIGENKFIYDMWSDAVNTASRMESSSIAGEVHVSERFKEAVTEYEEFDYVERGEMDIKGKGKMKTYFIGERKV